MPDALKPDRSCDITFEVQGSRFWVAGFEVRVVGYRVRILSIPDLKIIGHSAWGLKASEIQFRSYAMRFALGSMPAEP